MRRVILLSWIAHASAALIVVRRLRIGSSCPTIAEACPARVPADCIKEPQGSCAQLAVLKVPRTGSTWLREELRQVGAAIEFEPFTDPLAHTCQGRFYTQALGKALVERLRCVTREARSLPCYWGWLKCNATRLKPRPSTSATTKLLTGYLINPMYAPGAIWNRVLSSQPRAKLVWLRRTNLVKMALSDIRRLAGAAARHLPTGSSKTVASVDPRTLLTRLNMTLVTQATFPAATALDRGFLLLYEDLQTQRLTVLRSLFGYLGIAHLSAIATELRRQQLAPSVPSTHWSKASEDVCNSLPPGNCAQLNASFVGKPCLLQQLMSTTTRAWSFPNHAGTLSFENLDGECAELPLLAEPVETKPEMGNAGQLSVSTCTRGRRTLHDLFGTRLPLVAPTVAQDASARAPAPAADCGHHRRVQISQSYVLPYSLTRQPLSSSSTSLRHITSTVKMPHASNQGTIGSARGWDEVTKSKRGQAGRSSSVPAPHMIRPWQRMVRANETADANLGKKGSVRFVIFSRQRSASTTFVGLLNLHPNVTCRWESFSNSFTASKMRKFLGIDNRTDQLANVPKFMKRFWGACPSTACGFKLLNAQIRPMEKTQHIFTVANPEQENGEAIPSPIPVKRLLLERADIAAEFDSWRRAQSTGNWGTSPEGEYPSVSTACAYKAPQARVIQAAKNGSRPMAFHKTHNTGCRGCDPEAVAKNQAMANSIGPMRFAFQHKSWFRFARDVGSGTPLLHIYSENLTSSMVVCNRTMARVYEFLELPPLRENCNISKLPLEWPCDIQNDPQCSMEKYSATGLHD